MDLDVIHIKLWNLRATEPLGEWGCLSLHKLGGRGKSGPNVFSQFENLLLVHFCVRIVLNTFKYEANLLEKGVYN